MGQAKHMLEVISARGYEPTNLRICSTCIGEDYLAEFIQDNSSDEPCSFCESAVSTGLEDVLAVILPALHEEYDGPVNCVGWCSAEGGWLGVENRIWDTEDLLYHFLDCEEEVMRALCNLIPQAEWVYRDPYGAREHEELFYSWEVFSDIVKHKTRYVFFRLERTNNQHHEFKVEPIDILDEIEKIIRTNEMTRRIPRGHTVLRARCSGSCSFTTPIELGPPPPKAARSSRMSPTGIPMFYCAADEDTCLAETVSWTKTLVTLSTWQSKRDLNVVDLTNIPQVPSIFDEINRDSRMPLLFIRNFARDFCKRIKRDDLDHVEYVPTQIVTEYIRRVFKTAEGIKVDGIVYKSSTGPGTCYVFFFDQADFFDTDEDGKEPPFELMNHKTRTIRHKRTKA